MSQVISLAAVRHMSPWHTRQLESAESVFLLSIRWWVADHRDDADPMPRLQSALITARAPDAAAPLDRLMTVIARTARRPIAIHMPRCALLSKDERYLLQALCHAKAGDGRSAERLLDATLVSTIGAQFALGPLEGLATLFAGAGLRFRRPQPTEVQAVLSAAWASHDNRSIH